MSGRHWLLGCWVLLTGMGMAHPILQNPMWVEVAPEVLKVKIYVSVRELNVVQGLPIAGDGAVDTALAVETAPRHSGYVLDHLRLLADGIPLSGTVTGIEPPKDVGKGMEGPDRAHFVYRIEYPLAQPPAQIALSHTMVQEFPSAPGVPWDLSYTYRFGPPGATPVEFGSITRGVEVVYKTGFAQLPGTLPIATAIAPIWPLTIRFILLGTALGLGVGNRRTLGRLFGVIAMATLMGWGLAAVFNLKMPAFLAAALGGIGILLVSVDNIHRPLAPFQAGRWVLAVFFPAAVGLAAWTMASAPVPFHYGFLGPCVALLLGGGLLGAAIAIPSAARPVPEGGVARHPWIQLASLVVCAGGLFVLMEGLGLRPWAYWLTRLGG